MTPIFTGARYSIGLDEIRSMRRDAARVSTRPRQGSCYCLDRPAIRERGQRAPQLCADVRRPNAPQQWISCTNAGIIAAVVRTPDEVHIGTSGEGLRRQQRYPRADRAILCERRFNPPAGGDDRGQ
jgi:hypothetical protein